MSTTAQQAVPVTRTMVRAERDPRDMWAQYPVERTGAPSGGPTRQTALRSSDRSAACLLPRPPAVRGRAGSRTTRYRRTVVPTGESAWITLNTLNSFDPEVLPAPALPAALGVPVGLPVPPPMSVLLTAPRCSCTPRAPETPPGNVTVTTVRCGVD